MRATSPHLQFDQIAYRRRRNKLMANYPIVHLEIPATDANAAGTFYGDVFGWTIQTNLEHNYTTFETEGGPRGGFVGPGDSPLGYQVDRLLVYLATDDIEGTLATIEAHGGKTVLPKTEIPHVGWWAVFADPTGNHLGLFTSTRGRG
jgi:uncharacterized protein